MLALNQEETYMTVEEIRRSHNLTQKEFADRIGISPRSYTYKITGEKPWLPAELKAISDYCDEIEIPCGSGTMIVNIAHNVSK